MLNLFRKKQKKLIQYFFINLNESTLRLYAFHNFKEIFINLLTLSYSNKTFLFFWVIFNICSHLHIPPAIFLCNVRNLWNLTNNGLNNSSRVGFSIDKTVLIVCQTQKYFYCSPASRSVFLNKRHVYF